ncbi:hypothetical protein N7449_005103, partial [Penicillium cf. viridicatum]
STFSTTSVSTRDLAPIRLYTVRVWFSPKGFKPIKDIKKKGLEDVLGTQYKAYSNYRTTKKVFLVDLAVLETGILRVLGKYRILDFVPLSSDNPTISQQPEYIKRQRACIVLGVEMSKLWTDWYDGCLREIGNYLRKLGYY